MMKPKICILRSDGINCDEELFYAFNLAGAVSRFVHINELKNKSVDLQEFNVLALPGGFSYGDDIVSGKILAIELVTQLGKNLNKFIDDKKIILGICNGFQTLVRTGLLPFNRLGYIDSTLINNESGRFECRWIKIKSIKSKASFFDNVGTMEVAVNHGEGKFFADNQITKKLKTNNQIIFKYCDYTNRPTQKYPDNPNGSIDAIAGITDITGRIIGLMPHPEKFVDFTQHPNFRRIEFDKNKKPDGLKFFQSIVQSFN